MQAGKFRRGQPDTAPQLFAALFIHRQSGAKDT
jgi:hypothetical protein